MRGITFLLRRRSGSLRPWAWRSEPLRLRRVRRHRMRPHDLTRREFVTTATVAGLASLTAGQLTAAEAPKHQRVEFTRLVAHWDEYTSPEYLRFIDEVHPEIAQVGFYGAH